MRKLLNKQIKSEVGIAIVGAVAIIASFIIVTV